MLRHVKSPSIVKAIGNKPKLIEEFVGRVNSNESDVSIARMKSPGGWSEPGQTPEFTEYTLVLSGTVHIASRDGSIDVRAGEAAVALAAEWVQYSTPEPGGAEYISVCVPAFSPSIAHRDPHELN